MIELGFILALCRGVDLFTTWLATPTLAWEWNPLMRRLGWLRIVTLNCGFIVFLTLIAPAVVILVASGMSLLVAIWNTGLYLIYGRRY